MLLGSAFRLLGHYNLSAYQRAMARRAGIEDLLPLTILNRKYEFAIPYSGVSHMRYGEGGFLLVKASVLV